MNWLSRIVLAGGLSLMVGYAVLHGVTFRAPSARAQDSISMTPAGQLVGRITAEDGGAPIANVQVSAFPDTYYESYPTALSDSTGTYTLTLSPEYDKYRLFFDPPNTSPYALEYYPHKRTLEEAELIAPPTDTAGRLDVTLLTGGTIRGTVNSSWYDQPIDLPTVNLFDEQGRGVTSNFYAWFGGQEEPAGTYALYNVPAGSYQLLIYANYHYGLQSPTLVTVTPGATATGPHAHLLYAASVVSIGTSPALPNVIALALDRQPKPLVSLNGGRTWQYLPAAPWIADDERFAYPDRFPEGGLVTALASRGAAADGIRFIVGTALEPSENSNPPVVTRGLYRSGDVGQSWANATIQTQVQPSSCNDGRFSTPVVTPAEPKNLYVLQKCDIYTSTQLYVSHDAGMTWQDVTKDDGHTIALHIFARIVVSPFVKDEIYLFDGEEQWYHSVDSGVNWEKISLPVDSFIFDGNDPDYLYGWAPFNVYANPVGMRSRDGGATWEAWGQQLCDSRDNGDPPLLLPAVGHAQTFFLRCNFPSFGQGMGLNGGIFRTDDGGDSWQRVTDELGHILALDYGTPGRLLWAKLDGLWASSNLGESWDRILADYLPVDTMPLYLPSLKSAE